MITKTGNELLHGVKGVATSIGKDLVSPLNLALNAFTVSSGMQSVGDAAGMSVGAIAGNKLYNKFSNKYIAPLGARLQSRLPGRWGAVAKGAVGLANAVGGFTFPVLTSSIGSRIGDKYAPIYKRNG